MTKAAWMALFSSIVLFACSSSAPPATGDPAATKAAVETATKTFHEALRTNDSATFMSFIDDSVLLMPPGEPAVHGKDGLARWYSGFLSQYKTSSLTLNDREVIVGGDWAVELGSYAWSLTPAAGGAEIVDRGNYMQVWKKQADGQWRFAREIWNSSVQPTI